MLHSIKAISLFSGIGAFELAAKLVFGELYQTLQFVEIDPIAQKVLQSHFPGIPVWSDILNYHPQHNQEIGFPLVIVGGFPCTNTSNAGKREGLSGNESVLWWEMYRVILEIRPDFVVVENPEGIIYRGLRTILGAFKLAGYTCEIEIISAAELGAPHRRNRVFVVAYSNLLALESRQGWKCWAESIGTDIETAREIGARSQIKPGSVCLDVSFPSWLDGISFNGWWNYNKPPSKCGVKPRTKGRRECINLYGGSIVTLQAAIPLMRLKFLATLTC